jgi:methionyl-tRNA formyltransferase
MRNINEAVVVLVCTDCDNTRILYHGIKENIPIAQVITELPVSKKRIISRRIKKLGIWTTVSQLAFQVIVAPIMRKLSAKRIRTILQEKNLSTSPIPTEKTVKLNSVNQKEFIDTIQSLNPDLILVNGTRIISAQTLSQINCPVINVHVGITPLYRGVHGAYWALASNDLKNCGVTIHAVDKGIDTGAILIQDSIAPTREDNFITYPYLQFEKAIELVNRIVPVVLSKSYSYQNAPSGNSKLWYHPTIWQYINNWFKKGIK